MTKRVMFIFFFSISIMFIRHFSWDIPCILYQLAMPRGLHTHVKGEHMRQDNARGYICTMQCIFNRGDISLIIEWKISIHFTMRVNIVYINFLYNLFSQNETLKKLIYLFLHFRLFSQEVTFLIYLQFSVCFCNVYMCCFSVQSSSF